MGVLAMTILILAIAGAIASWVVGAVHYARCLSALEGPAAASSRWVAVAAWPFALKRLKGSAVDDAAVVNKAIVAFLICLTVAALTISLSTNYSRISK